MATNAGDTRTEAAIAAANAETLAALGKDVAVTDAINRVNNFTVLPTDPTTGNILAPNNPDISLEIARLRARSSIGDTTMAQGDAFYGLNHRGTPGALPINKDKFGYTFFTRPELNLSTPNLRAIRKFTSLLTKDTRNIPAIIRRYLDPRLSQGFDTQDPYSFAMPSPSDYVDEELAFIPILSQTLQSASGWPDIALNTYDAPPGQQGESYSIVDSAVDIYRTYDVTCVFRNIKGDPITLLFQIWCEYMSYVYQGSMVPYPDKIIQNEIDYQTRIYRLVMDSTNQYVQKIGACGAAFPTNSPTGAAFSHEHATPFNQANDQISITFRCMGFMQYDPILIKEFNKVVQLFNEAMYDPQHRGYVKIPQNALVLFNNRGYPRINTKNLALEWWIQKDIYLASGLPLPTPPDMTAYDADPKHAPEKY